MARFTIELPDNKKCEVHRYDVKKVQWTDYLKKTRKSFTVESSSEPIYSPNGFHYVVNVFGSETNTEFSLFKLGNGEWFKDCQGTMQLDDELIVIKNAIIDKEKEFNPT